MIYEALPLDQKLTVQSCRKEEAAMYELFGALAFALVVAGYVLAIIFVRHEDDGCKRPTSVRREGSQ
jgi:hypothetical protein